MNTHEAFVHIETAKMLDRAGFDWDCEHTYEYEKDGYTYIIRKPTLDVAQRWIREVKGIDIMINICSEDEHKVYFNDITIYVDEENWRREFADDNTYETYEVAQETAIIRALNLLDES